MPEFEVSSHYLIPETSDNSYRKSELDIYQLVDETNRAWHAGKSKWEDGENINDQSIGIELVNRSKCYYQEDNDKLDYKNDYLCIFPDYDPLQIQLHGFSSPSQPSRFLFEIPETLVNESSRLTRLGLKTKQTKIEKADGSISLGQRIAHPKFGEGIVIGLEGDGDHTRAQINFESEGIKWLVLGYAKLKLM